MSINAHKLYDSVKGKGEEGGRSKSEVNGTLGKRQRFEFLRTALVFVIYRLDAIYAKNTERSKTTFSLDA